jgi:hypothetical protein
MPSDSFYIWPVRWDRPFSQPINHCSSYDNCHVPWGTSHEENWIMTKKLDFVAGTFVWTGFDYLGEPTPFGWPSRSSYFGIIDLAGFPKDVYYMYQSEWTNRKVLHVFPHWNWEPGQVTDVWAYYTHADQVELFLNGKSLGVRSKQGDELHVWWRIPFEPGILKAVSRKEGKEVLLYIRAEAEKYGYFMDLNDPREYMFHDCIRYKNGGKIFLYAGENQSDNYSGNLRRGVSVKAEFKNIFTNENKKMDELVRRFPEVFKATCSFCFHRRTSCPGSAGN